MVKQSNDVGRWESGYGLGFVAVSCFNLLVKGKEEEIDACLPYYTAGGRWIILPYNFVFFSE